MPGRMEQVPASLYGQSGPWVAPRSDRSSLDDPSEVWVDDSYTGSEGGYGVTLFNTIQAGIDAVAAGGIVNVYPGNYNETASGRYLFDATGPYQFGLFIGTAKSGITVRGVDAGGTPLTNYTSAHTVQTNPTNSFGYSGTFVEGDNVTITGLGFHSPDAYVNKTIEVIGDNFTIRYCRIEDGPTIGGGSLYLNDWRYDTGTNTSHLQSYTIEYNYFPYGNSLDIASGAGYSGSTSGRLIRYNDYDLGGWDWNGISFSGSGTGVPWFVYSVGGAVITGNSFTGGALQYIRVRGTYDDSQFDWQSYWLNNTFNKKAVVVQGGLWANSVRTYSYTSGSYTFNNVRRIGSTIAGELAHAQSGDLMLLGSGTYAEWDLAITVPLTLRGAGASTIIDASSYAPPDASHRVLGINVAGGDVTVEQLKVNHKKIYGITASGNTNPASVITIDYVEFEGNGYNSDPAPGKDFSIIAGYGQTAKVVVSNCNLHDTYENVMLFERQLGETDIHHNTVTDAYTVFYMTYNGAHVTTLQKFHHNTLSGGEIYFNSASQYYAPTTAGKYTNIEVSDNTFSNIGTGMRAMGAGNDNGVTPADGEIVAPRFLRNTVNGISGGSNYRGLQLLGYITDARVENNYIHDVDVGIRVWTFYAPGIYPVGTKIYRNSIVNCGSKALRWDGPGDINASVNYWGAAPVWASIFTGSVDYTPWCLLDGTYNNPGFTPNLSQLQVEAASPQTGLVSRIQEGINETVGSTVYVSAGTYNENIVINTTVTLDGAGSGSNPASNTIINGGGGIGIMMNVGGTSALDRLVLKDLRVTGCSNAVRTDNAIAYVTFDNLFVTANSSYGVEIHNAASINDLVVTNSSFTGHTGYAFRVRGSVTEFVATNCHFDDNPGPNGSGFATVAGCGESAPFDNVQFTNCTFNNDVLKGAYFEKLSNATFTNCVVNNSGTVAVGTGINVNLKYGTYANITFNNVTITNSGTGYASGSGLLITGRNDGGYSSCPATITNVDIIGGIYSGCPNNISVGNYVTDLDIGGATATGGSATGIVLWVDAGLTANIHDCRLAGNAFNAADTQPGHTWGANCYSDYGPAHAGYPDYAIPGGGGNVDLNPNANGCADVDFVTTSALVGCPGGCVNDTLYIRLDLAGYYSGQLILQLPAGLSSYLTPVMSDVAPVAGPMRTGNLQFTFARSLAGNQIELNPIWGAGSPSVSDGGFFACIPVYNSSSTHGLTLLVAPVSYDFANASGEHTTDLFIGNTTLTVDCDDPSATLGGGGGAGGCNAYGTAGQFDNALNYTMAAAGLNGPPESPLASAYMKLGTQTWALALTDGTFPTGSESPSVWTTMAEGCNTFELHVLDTECNEAVVSLADVVKDTQAPSPSVAYTQSACYNNIPTDPQYGATLLDGDLDIDLAAALACQASTFSLSFTVNAISISEGLSAVANITDYPFGTHAQDLWDDIVGVIGGSYSGSVTIGWTVTDCAGNAATGSFSIPCVDFQPPSNTFTVFDARPTYNGVWLKWAWTYNVSQATAVEIWRKGEGDYPVYSGNLSMSDGNYEKVHANLVANGWTQAATQTGPNNTAALYPGTHHTDGVLGTYWKDNIDDATARDIYRYVTFVRDAAGNWSQVGSYTLLTNADRSTSYWLGDYSLHAGNPVGSQGIVEGVDLGLLSAHYFETVGPAPSYLDIGPENHENAYGKGIPNPNQVIDFFDLLPFSYNYGVAGQTGFSVQPPSSAPFDQLDAAPVVNVMRANDALLEVGSVFDVVVTLTGNDGHSAKVVDAQIEFDPEILELVSVTTGAMEVLDGIPWSKACAIPGQPNRIGAAAAAMGEIATINGDVTLATIQFRWKADRVGATGIQVLSTHIADAYGHVIDGEASTLNIGATGVIPTSYALYQNYPNPFNPTTQIRYDLPEDANVRLVIYNVMGQEVRTLVSGTMPAGSHHIMWDGLSNEGRAVGSGLYIYRINANTFTATHKMLLTR